MSAPDSEHNSISRCQSAEFRAKRDTSSPPTQPIAQSCQRIRMKYRYIADSYY
jgi:hypothetical protein